MICLRCNNEEFKRNENALVEQEVRGKTFKVKTTVMECTKCGWQALTDGMVDEFIKNARAVMRGLKQETKE
jgi:uncharacterized protein with PIN domain